MKNRRKILAAILVMATVSLQAGTVYAEELTEALVAGANTVDLPAEQTTAEVQVQHPITPYDMVNLEIFDGGDTSSFSMMGVPYNYGIRISNYDSFRRVMYNLDRNFTKVMFDVGHIDEARGGSAIMNVYADGELVSQHQLTSDMVTAKVVVDVQDVKQLRVEMEGSDAAYAIVNAVAEGGHIYTKEMTMMASVVQEGTYTYTCETCGITYDEVIPKLEACVPPLYPYQMSNYWAPESTDDTLDGFTVMGKVYYAGLSRENYDSHREALYNLGQMYNSVTFTVGHQDYERRGGATLRVYADGNLMKEVELVSYMVEQEISINTKGVTQLKITCDGSDSAYCIYNLTYEKDGEMVHNFVSETVLEATTENTGIKQNTCQNCGITYTEMIPVLGSEFQFQ